MHNTERTVGCSYTVNGVAHTSADGTHDVKAAFGQRAVLIRAQPGSAPAAAAPAQDGSTPAGRVFGFTICAVDARGRFHVEDGGAYEVATLWPPAEASLTPAATSASRQPQRSKRPRREGRAQSGPSKYSQFVSHFGRKFAARGFQACAMEWRLLSPEARENDDVETLIAAVARAGRHRLRAPPLQERDEVPAAAPPPSQP